MTAMQISRKTRTRATIYESTQQIYVSLVVFTQHSFTEIGRYILPIALFRW